MLLKFIETAIDQHEINLALAVNFGRKLRQRAVKIITLLLLAGQQQLLIPLV